MGSILKRTNPSGETVYRAQIRIAKAGYPNYSESKTFSKRALAAAWLKKREAELEANPDLLFSKGKKRAVLPTLAEASKRYLEETQGTYAVNKASVIRLLGVSSLGSLRLDRLKRSDFAAYALERQRGIPSMGLRPVSPSTINGDLQYLRSLLKHAHFVWGYEQAVWTELDLAMEGLRRSRVIGKAQERERLPTADELQALTTYFYRQWCDYPATSRLPMHLIMWFAIYSCRREGELGRLAWADYRADLGEWLVRDVKHPRGSKGNHKIFAVRSELLPVMAAFRQPELLARMQRWGGNPDLLLGGAQSRSVSAAWRGGYKILGIKDLRFHDLRHEGATRLAEDGLTIPQMQQVTLHSDWQMLQRYVNMGTRPRLQRLDFAEAMRVASDGTFRLPESE